MGKTANVYARIEPELKEEAESILSDLGISASSAITMFYKQIIINKGIPFELKLKVKKPLAYGSLTKEQLNTEIEEGMVDIREGRTYTMDEVVSDLKQNYGI